MRICDLQGHIGKSEKSRKNLNVFNSTVKIKICSQLIEISIKNLILICDPLGGRVFHLNSVLEHSLLSWI